VIRNAYTVFVGKHDVKRQLTRPRATWEANIKMDLNETECEVVGWIYLAQGRDQRRNVVNMVMNFWVP
jgi:hypothetical protein